MPAPHPTQSRPVIIRIHQKLTSAGLRVHLIHHFAVLLYIYAGGLRLFIGRLWLCHICCLSGQAQLPGVWGPACICSASTRPVACFRIRREPDVLVRRCSSFRGTEHQTTELKAVRVTAVVLGKSNAPREYPPLPLQQRRKPPVTNRFLTLEPSPTPSTQGSRSLSCYLLVVTRFHYYVRWCYSSSIAGTAKLLRPMEQSAHHRSMVS